jgi:peptidoglycan/xylan/chitin deacetylase (PgdA/CDA1 family)
MMRKIARALIMIVFCLLSLVTPLNADNSAVVLLYHRFAEDGYPSTNIRTEQFESHLAQLKAGGYNFMSVAQAVDQMKQGAVFPSRTVIITVDDAYKSVVDTGWPMMKAAGVPFTLFVSTDPVDAGHGNYMNWNDVRRLAVEGVDIGHHTASHLHMVAAGLEVAMADVRKASERFNAELGAIPKIFAYPYGEYNLEMAAAIEKEGFTAAFAQYSGPIASWVNKFALPRFPVNERYGDIGRFKLVSQALALPITDLIPQNPMLSDTTNPPLLGFTVEQEVGNLQAMACYPSHLGKAAELSVINGRRVEVRFEKPFPRGRNRINCTMPAGKGRWYWLGQFYLRPGGRLD